MRLSLDITRAELGGFDAWLTAEMMIMLLAIDALAIKTEGMMGMTTGRDVTNSHKYYYQWYEVSIERLPNVLAGYDRRPKNLCAWLTVDDYHTGGLHVGFRCADEYDETFQRLIDELLRLYPEDTKLQSARQGQDPQPMPSPSPKTPEGGELLTGREKQIAHLLADGMDYKEIATKFVCSPSTVKRHADNIQAKWEFVGGGKLLQAEAKRRGFGGSVENLH